MVELFNRSWNIVTAELKLWRQLAGTYYQQERLSPGRYLEAGSLEGIAL